MALPTTSAHLSDLPVADMIEQYGGAVDAQFAKSSIMRKMVTVKPVRGTDTLINRRVGRTTLTALTPGVRPDASKTEFGRVSVTVDTVVLARDNRSMLNEFQTDFSARDELGKDHGKEQAKFFDQAFLIQAIKGASLAAPANLNGSIGAGKKETLLASNDHLDPDLLYKAITRILIAMQEEDIDTEECAILVRPTMGEVLLNNDKLVSREFSPDNSNFSLGKMKSIMGSPLISTARIPNAAIAGHKLSNAGNSNAYDVSAAEAKAVAVIMHPDSLLAGETIPLTSDVYFDKIEKQWFIDSFTAFGVSNRRPDVCGVVNRF
ncbi:hypothetical protein SAMN05216227_102046 [Pseudorhodobacter antarcticus]|uniref:Phage major capsid protein, HK97 family n=1 Tax=Pseudorhodobacter antarcticus TaxID=1077947 RepID=A0A1H8IIA0_9RHOB|nr:capsid protein [Pseudorhodobacter antarcticus]SEN68005.1 hypothetical protein SAMN05216227_102046 [Pseudorhodobacter antarcticus]